MCKKRFDFPEINNKTTETVNIKNEVHHCENGNLGLADFVGFRLEENRRE